MIGNGLNRPTTMEIRLGDQFNVMVTADLAFRDRIWTDSYTIVHGDGAREESRFWMLPPPGPVATEVSDITTPTDAAGAK